MSDGTNLTDEQRLQLEAWCSALVDGVITSEEQSALEARLLENAAARSHYVRYLGLSASLQEYAGGSLTARKGRPSQQRGHASWWWSGAVAAAFVAAGLVFWHQRSIPTNVVVEEDAGEEIAMLASSENCVWENLHPTVGASFTVGQKLNLVAGLAEVAFDCGARVMLQGPTTVELTSAWSATLKQGTLHANVPPEAIGFRVVNPEVDVVDLGTEFSVVTDELGASEVFVHQGAVEVHPKRRKQAESKAAKAVLREKESRRFAQGQSSAVRDVERKWLALAKPPLPAQLQPRVQHRWPWQPGEISGLVPSTNATVKFTPAPFGHALVLDGSYGAQVSLPSLEQADARTVALWLRIPPDAPLADAPPFLSWRPQGRGEVFEAGTNDDPSSGIVGALKMRLGSRQLICSKSLRDGLWHHVAIVLVKITKAQGNIDWQARMFVDGRQETRSGKAPVSKSKSKHLPGLWIATGVDSDVGEYFVGELGGLFLTDGVLTPLEIRQLMK